MPRRLVRSQRRNMIRLGLRNVLDLLLMISTLFWVAVDSALIPATPNQPSAEVATDLTKKRLIGFYLSQSSIYQQPPCFPADIDGSRLTHLIYGHSVVNDSNLLDSGDAWNDYLRPAGPSCACCANGNYYQLSILRKTFQHLRVILGIGGWSGSQFMSNAVQSPLAFSRSIVNWVVRFGFDGVDLDWQYPILGGASSTIKRPEDCTNYMLFLKQLRQQFDRVAFNKRYTITVTLQPDAQFNVQCLDWKTLPNYVDFVNVMVFDLGIWSTQNTRHMAPLESSSSSDSISVKSIMEKFVQLSGMGSEYFTVGIAEYGRLFQQVQGGNNGLGQSFSFNNPIQKVDYSSVLKTQALAGYSTFWDETAQMNWIWNSQRSEFISFETIDSANSKARWVLTQDYGGIFLYDIGQEKSVPAGKSLLTTIHSVYQAAKAFDVTGDLLCVDSPMYCNINCSLTNIPKLGDLGQSAVPIIKQCKQSSTLTLAFTGGPSSNTPKILDILDRKFTKAIFFIVGSQIQNLRDTSRLFDIFMRGHTVAQAGYNFTSFKRMTAVDIRNSLRMTDLVIGQTLGVCPIFMTPPLKEYDATTAATINDLGYQIIDSNVDVPTTKDDGSKMTLIEIEAWVDRQLLGINRDSPDRWIVNIQESVTQSPEITETILGLIARRGYKLENVSVCLGPSFSPYRSVPLTQLNSQYPDFNAPFSNQCKTPGRLMISFGPAPSANMPAILDFLLQKNMKAIFFVLGSQIQSNAYYSHYLLRAHREGHIIAHHAFFLKSFDTMNDIDIITDLYQNDRVISAIIGEKPTLVFPPFGRGNARIRNLLKSSGYTMFVNNMDPTEWNFFQIYGSTSDTQYQASVLNRYRLVMNNPFDAPSTSSFFSYQALSLFNDKLQNSIFDLIGGMGYSVIEPAKCLVGQPFYRSRSPVCGDFICDRPDENCAKCPADCVCPDAPSPYDSRNQTAPPAPAPEAPPVLSLFQAVWIGVIGFLVVSIAITFGVIRYIKSHETKEPVPRTPSSNPKARQPLPSLLTQSQSNFNSSRDSVATTALSPKYSQMSVEQPDSLIYQRNLPPKPKGHAVQTLYGEVTMKRQPVRTVYNEQANNAPKVGRAGNIREQNRTLYGEARMGTSNSSLDNV